MIGHPPSSPLFPYTTLSHSDHVPFARGHLTASAACSIQPRTAHWLNSPSPSRPRARRSPGCRGRIGDCSPLTKTASRDRKSTRLNSSHLVISYAVFCLKEKE